MPAKPVEFEVSVACPDLLWPGLVSTHVLRIVARTAGAAARRAFRALLRGGDLRRQPKTISGGGFEGVSIRFAREAAAHRT